MARVFMVVRVMPSDTEVDVTNLVERIISSIPQDMVVEEVRTEPFAFGLTSILLGISVPEEEGVTERLEVLLQSLEGVGEVNVEGMTRMRR